MLDVGQTYMPLSREKMLIRKRIRCLDILGHSRLIPDEVEAGSGWWLSSRAYFDGCVTERERRPPHLNRDGNNQIVPIAFGICKGETGPCWSWWMAVLKECIGDNPSLLFISDRHAAIALAVQNEFPLAYYAVCCRHLLMNLTLKGDKKRLYFGKYARLTQQKNFQAA
ncbi:transposase, MuDR, MULE transposase domain protein [Tanacetum coccineum]